MRRQSELSNNPPVFYYVRVSALNAELGEGPFSNIVELRKMERKFEAPLNFRLRNVNSTFATLTWEYSLDTLKYLHRHFSMHMHFHHQQAPATSLVRSHSKFSDEHELLKSLHFAFYLKNRRFFDADTPALVHIKNAELVKLMQVNGRSFRNLTAMSCLNASFFDDHANRKNKNAANNNGLLSFGFDLKNLYPNTEYTIEMSARWFMLESQPTSTLKLTTSGNF
jgi:hypothetical protein